ncbi:MAG: hypothetical protein OHK0015_39060 [Chloroflexi bacterium OHK40]
MINLLYHSHTVVPAHLAELEGLGFVEPDEQILVALDGVLQDGDGRRLSGPTLHDYCLVTTLRVVLWARDYGRHLCYAFPLAELLACEGAGLDPLHATLQLTFAGDEATGEPEQRFMLTLLPTASLQAAVALLTSASAAARALQAQGVDARAAGSEIIAVLSAQIYGHVDGPRPGETPYRWPGAVAQGPLTPAPAFHHNPANLPPGQVYAAGRLARSAWDTLRRSLKEAELPFDLSSGSLRELTDAVRAINELVHTVASNPAAQQMAMAFINRGVAPPSATPAADPAWEAPAPPNAEPPREYREIPLRRRDPGRQPVPGPTSQTSPLPDRREIPLRRASARPAPYASTPLPATVSGSGDGTAEEHPPAGDDRR